MMAQIVKTHENNSIQ